MYPTPPVARPPSGQTADTLILIGFIFQLIVAIVWIAEAAATAVAVAVFGIYVGGLVALYIILLLIDLFGVWYVYTHFYQRSKAGNYQGARDAGILSIIFGLIGGAVIAGVLFIVAYLKLGDAVNEQRAMAAGAMMYPGGPMYAPPPGGAAPPPGMAPGAAAPAIAAGAAAGAASPPLPGSAAAAPMPPPAPVCPRCGKPGTWIAQYNRYYCYTDQQYL